MTTVVKNVAGVRVSRTIINAVANEIKFLVEDFKDQQVVVRKLNDLVLMVKTTTKLARTSPLLDSVLLEDITFTAGQTKYLKHGLGRSAKKFIVCDAQTADWSGRRAALLTGMSSDEQIAIRSTNAGTYSFLIF